MKKLNKFLIALIFTFVGLTNVKAEELSVCKIGEKYYQTLDEAIKEAPNGAVIELLYDVETEGISLNKNLTITSKNNNKIKFIKYGIALWGTNLTFENITIEMTGIGSTPYTAEWNWMAIGASKNASLTLNNSIMLMDGTDAGNAHAIYFCSNNHLNLTNSSLIIKNYAQDALEWDGGDGGYNVNIINSKFISDHNRSGFTGTFYVTIDNAQVDVINSTGNGSNGSNFIIKNSSLVNFNDNKAHGLSTGILSINNSKVNALKNGGNGIHTNDVLLIENKSQLNVKYNDCSISSKWTFPGAIHIGNNTQTSIIKDSEVNIIGNNGSGIYQKSKDASFIIENSSKVTITNNEAKLLGLGGGIYANGDVILTDNITLYNNHAKEAGDDIYSLKNITFSQIGTNWILDDCNHLINGWYDDVKDNRWNVHNQEQKEHIILIEPGIYKTTLALKAAHDKVKGNLIVEYVDEFGNSLSPKENMSDVVGNTYKTTAKKILNYELLKVEGNEVGKYIEGTVKVKYIYTLKKDFEIIPPHTGIETKKFTILNNINTFFLNIYFNIKKY